MKRAVVFPGQGSQAVGMGRDWAESDARAAAVYAEADARLGFQLSALCFDGPEDLLRLTENTQPAILATSIAVWECVKERLPAPAFFAGHSLGEYTALVAAGAIGLGDALALVRERGRLMQSAVPAGQGAMAAVLNLPAETIAQVCAEAAAESGEPLELANFNSPEQIVISGGARAMELALPRLQAAGAKRVVPLPVSAPFHSSLMQPAADGLRPQLEAADWRAATAPVIANLTAEPYPEDPAHFPALLSSQIVSSVRWTQSVRRLVELGATHLLEVGPGKVLRGLAPRIAPELKAGNIEKVAQLSELDDWLAEAADA